MSRWTADRALWARRTMILSGLAIVAALAVLTGDWIAELVRRSEDLRTVEALRQVVRSDPTVAESLHAERERQTAATIARRDRGRLLGWVLLVSAALFISAGRWRGNESEGAPPTLARLLDDRFPVASPPPRADRDPAEPEPSVEAFVDRLIATHGRDPEAAIPILHAVQRQYRFLPDEVLERVCRQTEITPAQIDGTSSFYARFRRSPVGRQVVRVCHGTACHVAGSGRITEELRRHLEIEPGQDTDPGREFTLDAVACLGCCSLAPVMMVEDETVGRLVPATARQALDARRSTS